MNSIGTPFNTGDNGTVTIKDAKMSTLTLMGRGIKLPTSSYSLTLEDGDGAIAY